MDACEADANNVLISNFSITSTVYLRKPQITKAVLTEKYTQNCLSMREIARHFLCSKTHVRDKLIEFEIPLRSACKLPKNRDARVYGKHKVAGKLINNKKEQAVISAIIKMHEDGLSANKIAQNLNYMNVPTKRNGKKWHHHSIIMILKRQNKYKQCNKGK